MRRQQKRRIAAAISAISLHDVPSIKESLLKLLSSTTTGTIYIDGAEVGCPVGSPEGCEVGIDDGCVGMLVGCPEG